MVIRTCRLICSSIDYYLNGDAGLEGRDKITVVLAREGQEIFRQRTLRNYSYRCCVTGLAVSGLLEAGHIVPWKLKGEENIRDRMDLGNGLCLNPLMHTAFDKGFMGIDEDMRVMYSRTSGTITVPSR
ncbi:MAG: HNH endonuclease [Candidatus Methanomethylophilus sp.]|jgi:putative restriction endonuclease|nr:HNH endonuclease [Methanomethylophilus sp.]MCI2093692.1 HNH endonuclease [Methanomethylophilus sp.]